MSSANPAAAPDTVLVVDFGAQYAQLIARRVREARVYSEIVPSTMPVAEMLAKNPAAIILSGGPSSVYAEGAPRLDRELFEAGVPVFGMCYGFQLMATTLGGTVDNTGAREYGRTPLHVSKSGSTLFEGTPDEQSVWMSHGDACSAAPEGFTVTASTDVVPVAAFENDEKKLYGVQYHPEVMHSTHGQQVLEHFLYRGAGLKPDWTTGNVIEEQVAAIREQVGDKRAICGLSGGVDSAVAAALVARAIGDQLTCVYVDHGLMRKGETEQVEKDFVAATGVKLVVVDAEERFLTALKGSPTPRRSGRSSAGSSSGSSSRRRPTSSRTRVPRSPSWSRARSTRTWSSPVAAPAPPTSSPTTTSAASPRTLSSSSSSRCASCSRTRCGWSARSSGSRTRSSSASRSRVPASASGSSARSPRSAWTSCATPTPSPARS